MGVKNKMNQLILLQAQFYKLSSTRELIAKLENQLTFIDEIDLFNKLVNFGTAKQIPYHRWVRYREGYAAELVKCLINRSNLQNDKEFILDPMVGSGTTLLAAADLGFDSLGIDINPFCKVITQAKFACPTNDDCLQIKKFLDSIKRIETTEDTALLSEFFSEKNSASLLELKKQIDALDSSVVKKILTAAWFFIIEDCSNRKKDGNGLATRLSKIDNVYDYYISTVYAMLEDYIQYPWDNKVKAFIECGSALELEKIVNNYNIENNKTLGAVIFSPPYANSFNYFESYKMELLFGGLLSMEDYELQRARQIRNYRICKNKQLISDIPVVEALCEEIELEIPKKEARLNIKDGRTRLMPNMLRGYFDDMRNVLKQIYNVLPVGKKCHIVVDQSAYVGVVVPTDTLFAYLAQEIGFNVESISVCRKANTSGQQLKAYPYLSSTLRESIVTLVKY